MLRLALVVTAAAAVLGAFALASPLTTHSQQPATADLLWDVAPVGLFADQRLRDGIDQLVDSQAVLDGGVSGTFRYAGSPGATQGQRDQVRLLFAAFGFDQPGTQIAQQRPCRIWIDTPALNAGQRSAVAAALTKQLVTGLATLGLKIDDCESASSALAADFLIWPASQASPLPQHHSRIDEQSFLIALPRPGETPNAPGRVGPPVTGDAGLLAR